MKYFTFSPPQSLAKHVRFFWVLEGEASPQKPYIHRSMADGCAELVFHYKGIFDELLSDHLTEQSFTSGLDAPTQHVRRFSITHDFGIFGAYLYPHAISVLFSIPATELKDQMLDLKTLLGKAENGLEEKMILAPDNAMRLKIITRFLEDRIAQSKPVAPGVFETIYHIIQNHGTTSVEQLAQLNFISPRQFERNFKQFTGFPPKLFSRIIRFQTALNQYGQKGKSLTEIAHDLNYSDQSHFIRDFKEFSGQNPKKFFTGEAEGTEWRAG